MKINPGNISKEDKEKIANYVASVIVDEKNAGTTDPDDSTVKYMNDIGIQIIVENAVPLIFVKPDSAKVFIINGMMMTYSQTEKLRDFLDSKLKSHNPL